MNDQLLPSSWTVSEARSLTAQLRQVARTGAEYDGLELFGALTGYLDQLYGGAGFDRLLSAQELAAMAEVVQRLRGRAQDPGDDTLVRLDQPVNAAVTLAEGRKLAGDLAAADDWPAELGRALQGLYSYLDHLYGGPGAFTELLTPDERDQVARRTPKR
ncbi:hypothetical protein GCM10009789_27240 [Kribbella sancticallisti]|uniref:Uncharacterized protein n=1 Tax=Kribbella sancticallisti TaxID=460087 RepID=A0ABN2D930_9ACTN